MNNKEIFQTLGETMAGILNGTMDLKEAQSIQIAANKSLKEQKKSLNNFKRVSKIAASRKEPLAIQKQGDTTFYGVIAASKEFYFQPGFEPEGSFIENGVEYLIVYKAVDFEW